MIGRRENWGEIFMQKAVVKDLLNSATTCINHWTMAEVDPRSLNVKKKKKKVRLPRL